MKIVEELKYELNDILNYWAKQTVDDEFGGFLGRIDHNNNLIKNSPKGSVLNSRILWMFSAAYGYNNNVLYKQLAERAFIYLKSNFFDKEFGGIYWMLDHQGNPIDTKKQTYALSFAIYGMAEFYKVSKNEEALDQAIHLFNDLEKHAFDKNLGGYFEAFSREWEEIADLRLSDKDANEKKTMNTHLHVLEAYSNLYTIWKNSVLEKQIRSLLNDFRIHIIDAETKHLILFMNEKWQYKQHIYSFGHDIEAAWLLLEAAEALDDKELINDFKTISVELVNAASEGLDEDGSLFYEQDLDKEHLIKEKHWWVQAEAMVGFLNAWQLTKEPEYYQKFEKVWTYIKHQIIDHNNGEWFWGRYGDENLMENEDKVGPWKCPYHNVRACLESIKRLY
jgi:mannobiose 2-epimerase